MRTKQLNYNHNYAVKSVTPRHSHDPSPLVFARKTVEHRRKTIAPKKRLTTPSEKEGTPKRNLSELRSVRLYGAYTNQIPKKSFWKVVKSIMRSFSKDDYKITASAVAALQEVAEEHMINFFERAAMLANHAKRVTIKPVDLDVIRRLEASYR